MLLMTSSKCRAIAEQKLAEAGCDKTHRRRLINAAEGWLFLAGQLRRLEKSFEPCARATPSPGRGAKQRSPYSTAIVTKDGATHAHRRVNPSE
jgi:hypothetical protein